jgi:hypothetical protein
MLQASSGDAWTLRAAVGLACKRSNVGSKAPARDETITKEQTDQGDFGIKRSGRDKSPRIFLKSSIWRRGGWGGEDVPDDDLREKHNNLVMAGTLGSLENLSTLQHSN